MQRSSSGSSSWRSSRRARPATPRHRPDAVVRASSSVVVDGDSATDRRGTAPRPTHLTSLPTGIPVRACRRPNPM
ncbi:hypothetical protein ACFPM0_33765 [Pseudonocardia sulfidoxydans]|uniref:hypothetical protein n=1 Tax=Pseudonocardia sulfidoxydans TaxID=54011 RepID=UPI00361C02AB